MHLRELRTILVSLYWDTGRGGSLSEAEVALVDRLLDAIHADIAGGGGRPRGDPAPYEPALGTPDMAPEGPVGAGNSDPSDHC